MSKSLFNEFEPVSVKAWKQKINTDLKGADYNETLIWHTLEGIDVKPFYHSEDLKEKPSTEIAINSWSICQTIYVSNAKSANKKAIKTIERGAESLRFIIPKDTIEVTDLFTDIDLTKTTIHLTLEFLSLDFVKTLNKVALHSNATFLLECDLIGNLAKSGNWYKNLKEDHEILEAIVENSTNLKSSLSVNADLYQNAGANSVQQLAYALAHVNEYLNHFGKKISNQITFNISIGSNYFFEIAKLRALRLLWTTVASEYFNNPQDCHINAVPSKRNKTLYDYNTNMLRTTTECMSAILGGANTVCNLAYDAIYHKENEFGDRIARNQLLILKHESYFDKVTNPTDGSYYIEELTAQLAEKALKLFKDIEANGGFLKQLKDGTIQRKIKESAAIEQDHFNRGDITLLGTNKHPNADDRMIDELELFPFVKTNPRKTLIEPIIEKRLAETIEQERLKTE